YEPGGSMKRLVGLGAALAAAVLLCARGYAAGTRGGYVGPVDATGDQLSGVTVARTVHGHCAPGSDAVPGPTYRCFTRNFIEDPCWADAAVAGSVLCMAQPWATSIVRVDVEEL